MTDLAMSSQPSFRLSRLQRAALACLILVALGDWLFFERDLGISIALFLAATALLSAMTQRRANERTNGRMRMGLVLQLIAALLPLVNDKNLLALGFGLAGLGAFVLIITRHWSGVRLATALQIAGLYVGPWRLAARTIQAMKIARRRDPRRPYTALFFTWCVPLIFGAIFLLLFASANPLIRQALGNFEIGTWLERLLSSRSLLWILLAIFTLPLLCVTAKIKGRRRKPIIATPHTLPTSLGKTSLFLTTGTILRALILFNLLFALQSVMDIIYLWGGVRLPNGMTYATYAHQGAYPLMMTALLAAAFVLVALRPGSEAERSPPIRWLVTLWVGQNVLLVISSILRLDLYVAIYSLTTLRLSAFIWMGLVAFGLIFILLRILQRRSNHWLVRINLIAATAVLYGCCFINFESLVADYNVDHAREFTGRGVALDMRYMAELGPHALPALDRYLARQAEMTSPPNARTLACAKQLRINFAWRIARPSKHRDWRAWTLQKARLWHYLDTVQPQTASISEPVAIKAPESGVTDATVPPRGAPDTTAPGDGN